MSITNRKNQRFIGGIVAQGGQQTAEKIRQRRSQLDRALKRER
jgi:hypothetical protein